MRKILVASLTTLMAVALVTTGSTGAVGKTAKKTSKPKLSLSKIAPQQGGGEPSIAIGPEGTIYVAPPTLSKMLFFRSKNHGKTWTQGASPEGNVGDTTVTTDRSGAVYETNLNNISEVTPNDLQVDLFKSFNKGKTWPQKAQGPVITSNASNMPLLVDRQWVDSWIPPGKKSSQARLYMAYHDFVPSQIWVQSSTDGGKTFGPQVDVINDPVAEADSFCSTIPGGLKIVPSGPHAGRVYVAWLAADPLNAATGCNLTQLQAFHDIWVASSDDGGLTWTDHLVYDAGPLHDGSEIFADITLDNKGNPYVAFAMNIESEFDIWVEASFDGGNTWNGKSDGTGHPYKVNADKGTHYFATIAAGDPGKVDVAYLDTPFIVPTTPYGKPQPAADQSADWNLYFAQSVNVRSGHPKWTNVRVTPKPMHHGDICTLGLFCSAVPGTNRDLLDFIDIAIDRYGLAHVAYTDDHNYKGGAFVAANQSGGTTVGPGGH
ncbi:MAG TPA: sialidase family protein [Actinomycetota bacterium]